MSTELISVSAFHRAIAEATSIADVKDLRDKAEAIRRYYAAAGAGLDAQNHGAEMKIRAERRIGELLAEMPKKANQYAGNTELPALSEIGITKMQSHRWQAMAAVDGDTFEDAITKTKLAHRELSSKQFYKLGKAAKHQPPVVHTEPVEGVTDDIDQLASTGQRFGTIYADPPWAYDNKATRSNVDSLYAGTMTIEQLCEMPVAELAADDAHLHMWTTNAFLPESFRLMAAWGFEYRSVFVWCKEQIGIGNYWRVSHEFMLLGIRGNAKSFARKDLRSWGVYDRGEHSAKPAGIRDLIEDVSPGPYLELFGRERIEGWTVFGNQVSTHKQRRFA